MPEPELKRPRVILKGKTAAAPGDAEGSGRRGGGEAADRELRRLSPGRRPWLGRAQGPVLAAAVEAAVSARRKTAATGESSRSARGNSHESHSASTASEPQHPASAAAAQTVTRFRARAAAPENGTVVTFDVGGQPFKVSLQLVRSRPDTLLANLLQDMGDSATSKPIFVDAAPSRFPFILDWYRYGEIHVPGSVPVAAVMQDARHFQLPDEVVVNGTLRSTRGHGTAHQVARALVSGVVSRWPGFDAFLESTLESIRAHFESVGTASSSCNASSAQDSDEAWDFPSFVLALYGEKGWVDAQHLTTAARARVLALKLEERGYHCEFSETELVVSLPLRLRAECAGDAAAHEAEEPVGEEAAGGEGH